MLDRVATYKEKTETLKAKIKKALTYPTAVIMVAIVVTTILLVKVAPQFPRHCRVLVPSCLHSPYWCSLSQTGFKPGGYFY